MTHAADGAPSVAAAPEQLLLARALSLLDRRAFTDARELLSEAVDAALATGNEAVLGPAGDALERLGGYGAAWRALAALSRRRVSEGPPEWDGASLVGRTIVVEQRMRHVGGAIRMGRLIAPLARVAKSCVVRAERRLIPLFARTFPGIRLLDEAEPAAAAYDGADFRASYETLCLHLSPSQREMEALFSPLLADTATARRMRQDYLGAGRQAARRVLGVSWGSFNPRKEILALDEWGELLEQMDDTALVSIQYGERQHEGDRLGKLAGRAVIWDRSVDQLQDIDRFAAQLASLDGIISISNSGCHLAGALGVPSVVLLDWDQSLIWNCLSAREPWYPWTIKLRRSDQAWPHLRDEIAVAIAGEMQRKQAAAL